nr:hypothetical protein [Snodgrassella alvi]
MIFSSKFYHLSIIHAIVLIYEEEKDKIAEFIEQIQISFVSFPVLINIYRSQPVFGGKKSNFYK